MATFTWYSDIRDLTWALSPMHLGFVFWHFSLFHWLAWWRCCIKGHCNEDLTPTRNFWIMHFAFVAGISNFTCISGRTTRPYISNFEQLLHHYLFLISLFFCFSPQEVGQIHSVSHPSVWDALHCICLSAWEHWSSSQTLHWAGAGILSGIIQLRDHAKKLLKN